LFTCFFSEIYNNLSDNGLFVFDIRDWGVGQEGNLIQQNKASNLKHFIKKVNVDGVDYYLYDKICYKDNFQLVNYIMENDNSNLVASLQYYIYTYTEAVNLLLTAGFQKNDIEVLQFDNYPYLVIIAKK
jgi:hypothetical protein